MVQITSKANKISTATDANCASQGKLRLKPYWNLFKKLCFTRKTPPKAILECVQNTMLIQVFHNCMSDIYR